MVVTHIHSVQKEHPTAYWQNKHGKKGFIWLTESSLSSEETKQELMAGALNISHRRMLLTSFSPHSYLANFVIYIALTHMHNDAAAHRGLGPLLSIRGVKKMPRRHAQRPALWRLFFSWYSIFLGVPYWHPNLVITEGGIFIIQKVRLMSQWGSFSDKFSKI